VWESGQLKIMRNLGEWMDQAGSKLIHFENILLNGMENNSKK